MVDGNTFRSVCIIYIMRWLIILLFVIIGDAYGEVYITDIRITPEDLHIGSILRIEATLVNNSNDTISYESGCNSPLSVEFSNNIIKEYGIGCLGFSIEDLKPFDNVNVNGPQAGILYKVKDYDLTTMNLSLNYYINEDRKSINKTIYFMINPNITNVNHSEFEIVSMKSISFKGLEFALLDVRDYRCPIDVVCIWQGDAELLLAIKKDGKIENSILTLNNPLIINNYIIKAVSLKPERMSTVENKVYNAKLSISNYEGKVMFKGYNAERGIIGILDLDNKHGLIILFEDGKRKIERFDINESICNRLSSMVCISINDRYIEIAKDFILINKDYIPTKRVITS